MIRITRATPCPEDARGSLRGRLETRSRVPVYSASMRGQTISCVRPRRYSFGLKVVVPARPLVLESMEARDRSDHRIALPVALESWVMGPGYSPSRARCSCHVHPRAVSPIDGHDCIGVRRSGRRRTVYRVSANQSIAMPDTKGACAFYLFSDGTKLDFISGLPALLKPAMIS